MVASPPISTMSTSSTQHWLQSLSSDTPSSNCNYARSMNMSFKPPWGVP
jgi:hypothetical protein